MGKRDTLRTESICLCLGGVLVLTLCGQDHSLLFPQEVSAVRSVTVLVEPSTCMRGTRFDCTVQLPVRGQLGSGI